MRERAREKASHIQRQSGYISEIYQDWNKNSKSEKINLQVIKHTTKWNEEKTRLVKRRFLPLPLSNSICLSQYLFSLSISFLSLNIFSLSQYPFSLTISFLSLNIFSLSQYLFSLSISFLSHNILSLSQHLFPLNIFSLSQYLLSQGSAADIVMMAMIKLWKSEILKNLGWKLLLQVNLLRKRKKKR